MLQKGPALRQVFLVRTAEWTGTLLGVGSGYADVDFRESRLAEVQNEKRRGGGGEERLECHPRK